MQLSLSGLRHLKDSNLSKWYFYIYLNQCKIEVVKFYYLNDQDLSLSTPHFLASCHRSVQRWMLSSSLQSWVESIKARSTWLCWWMQILSNVVRTYPYPPHIMTVQFLPKRSAFPSWWVCGVVWWLWRSYCSPPLLFLASKRLSSLLILSKIMSDT